MKDPEKSLTSLLVTINNLFSKLEASIGHLHSLRQVFMGVLGNIRFSSDHYQLLCYCLRLCSASIFIYIFLPILFLVNEILNSFSCADYAEWFICWWELFISFTTTGTARSQSRRVSTDRMWNKRFCKFGLPKFTKARWVHKSSGKDSVDLCYFIIVNNYLLFHLSMDCFIILWFFVSYLSFITIGGWTPKTQENNPVLDAVCMWSHWLVSFFSVAGTT